MAVLSARPKIYHITHVENLAGILDAGVLWSDAAMIQRGGPSATIGISKIKQRRLELTIPCHAPCTVGEFVPFYFCPRSVMLYVISKRYHPELAYRGGQEPIVHLEADVHEVVAWARRARRPWAFSRSNAGARYASFSADLSQLGELDWDAVHERNFQDPAVKEAKQAEFLVHDSFPWTLIERIGVHDKAIYHKCATLLASAGHKPRLELQPGWYY
ncbi:type II toxin-antitoxin system toxin DNA ADP-ribosyl transferase DarT [Nannocystis punicea]|uniref:DUF4433 domain-containing protein n=1 Tax=Nannocystis punicea TaxID=2995304 RepID=A0ABY7HEP3_9BACT|nr:DUF4433 domain-containing protein [Nannocystis poenicansa]WAS97434.1 DUF4433 domain-containing protein [Nannocystis poenicansa]